MKRINSFSGLRIFASAMITFYHMEFFESSTGVMGTLHHAFSGFGSIGVTIFILLSGFLNMYNYAPENFVRGYIKRKISKVYPLHLVTMLATMAFMFVSSSMTVSQCAIRLIPQLLMVQAFIPVESFYFSFNKLSWYLSLFLLFSVVDQPLLKWMNQRDRRKLELIIGAVLFVQLVWYAVFSTSSNAHWLCYINPVFRLSDYILGISLGGIFKSRSFMKNEGRWTATFLEAAALILICRSSLFSDMSFIG